MKNTVLVVFFSTIAVSTPVHACYSGYFAPKFLDITNPVIGLGILILLAAFIINIREKLKISAILVPTLFLLIYYVAYFSEIGLLEITNPLVWLIIFLFLVVYIVFITRALTFRSAFLPVLFLALSYYGHWNYGGDCGYEIVFFNRISTFIAASWLIYEVVMMYRKKHESKA